MNKTNVQHCVWWISEKTLNLWNFQLAMEISFEKGSARLLGSNFTWNINRQMDHANALTMKETWCRNKRKTHALFKKHSFGFSPFSIYQFIMRNNVTSSSSSSANFNCSWLNDGVWLKTCHQLIVEHWWIPLLMSIKENKQVINVQFKRLLSLTKYLVFVELWK